MRLGPSIGIDQCLHGFSADTTSRLLGAINSKALSPFRRVLNARDHCGLHGPDGAGLFLVFAAPRANPGRACAFEHKLAHTVLPHFATGLRLRRALTGLSLETASAEAIIEPGGCCLSAQGMAEPARARELLREACGKA